jgi:hypothetical protein
MRIARQNIRDTHKVCDPKNEPASKDALPNFSFMRPSMGLEEETMSVIAKVLFAGVLAAITACIQEPERGRIIKIRCVWVADEETGAMHEACSSKDPRPKGCWAAWDEDVRDSVYICPKS